MTGVYVRVGYNVCQGTHKRKWEKKMLCEGVVRIKTNKGLAHVHEQDNPTLTRRTKTRFSLHYFEVTLKDIFTPSLILFKAFSTGVK